MVKIKKKFIVIGVIVALILAAIIYTVIWSQDDSVSRLYLGTIVNNDDDTGIKVSSFVDPNGPGSVEGDGLAVPAARKRQPSLRGWRPQSVAVAEKFKEE